MRIPAAPETYPAQKSADIMWILKDEVLSWDHDTPFPSRLPRENPRQKISQLLLSLSRNFPLLPLQRMLNNRISKIPHSLVRQRDFRKESKEHNSPTEASSQRPRERCNSSGIWRPFSCRYRSFDILVMAHLCCECAHQYGSLILGEDVVELGGARW